MPDLDQDAAARIAAAETRATQAAVQVAVVSAAHRAGAIDPDAVARLLPVDAVTIDDNGAAVEVDEAVAALLVAKPYLLPSPSNRPPAGSANGGPQGNPPQRSGHVRTSRARARRRSRKPARRGLLNAILSGYGGEA